MATPATRFFATDPAQLTAEDEDRFFTALKTRNNTFKRTNSRRFSDVDRRCIQCFRQSGTPIDEVLDIGISSGTTTLALHAALSQAGYASRITGTDLSLTGYLLETGPGMRALVDEQGHPLQYEVLGRAVRAWSRRADAFTGMGLILVGLRSANRRAIAREFAGGFAGAKQIRLLSPRVQAHPAIRVEANDIFCPAEHFAGRFDFIRAANILNRGYFDEPQLRRALANVVSYLSGPGAYLLTARTVGDRTAGTLFRVTRDSHLIAIDRFGEGSEIEKLVLTTPVRASQSAA